jgi:type IV secretory pathway VirB10-like protein
MSHEQDPNAGAVPEMRNKSPLPPGVSAKRRQTMLMLAGGGAVVLVIALSNSPAPSRAKSKAGAAAGSNAVAPTTPKTIQQYAKQLDDDTRGLAQERARAEQMRVEALRANAAQQNLYQNPYAAVPQPGSAAAVPQSVRATSPQEAARIDQRRREAESLRASNVALTFRKDQPQPRTVDTNPTSDLADIRQLIEAQKAALLATMQRPPAVPATVATNTKEEPGETEPGPRRTKAADPALQDAAGKSFRLLEGTMIETVLTNRLNGSFSGPVIVLVTTAVYSHDGQHVLIPQGSRILGEVQRVAATGQQRLAVAFHRLIMPDGYSLSLDQFRGLNQIGETGLRDQANQHYLQIFGTSLALGAIGGATQAGGSYGYNTSGADLYRRGVAESLSSSATRILGRFLNVLPTITIREGHRVKVYLTDDLMLPAYENHRLPSDL